MLPTLLPRGVEVESHPCSVELGGGDSRRLSVKFFDEKLKGAAPGRAARRGLVAGLV